ncbi:MAG: hypothetical protein ACFCUN_03715 [Hyphomicrobiaceae bacterium]
MIEKKTELRAQAEGRAIHDVGGLDFGQIDREEHDLALWEKRVDALLRLLVMPAKGAFAIDAMRRVIEDYGEQTYDTTTYYEKWIRAVRTLCLERELFDSAELEAKIIAVEAAMRSEGRALAGGRVPYDGSSS